MTAEKEEMADRIRLVERPKAGFEELALRIKAGIDPAPACPYSHDRRARCPNCAAWPRLDETYRDEINRLARTLDVSPETVVRSALNLKRKSLLRAEATYEGALRASIVPGVNLDDGEPAPQPSRWRRVARWAGAVAMVVGAVSIMYAEGQAQRAPGVGFGIALGLLMGAALLLGGRDDG